MTNDHLAELALLEVSRVQREVWNRPLAIDSLTSYRCKSRFGWIMIGAKDHDEAYREALRSYDKARREDLQVWNGNDYEDLK